MPAIMKLALGLVAFLTLASATPTTYPAVIMGERDVASGSEPPCLCYDGTPIGFYCGFEEGASPGHLTGTCDPNLCYACGNGHQPMYHLDCPAQGQSCNAGEVNGRGGPGKDFCA